MVKKIKVVDVSTPDAIEETPQVEEAPQVEETPQVEEAQPVEETPQVEEAPPVEETVKEEVVKKTKPSEYIKCENCNKEVLMKTYKYSHKKVCKPSNAPPPPPPPPPTPEPKKARAKRVAKPKETPEEPPIPKTDFNGTVSFDEMKPVLVDPYITMRQERLMVRQQRVKSLISQAI